MRSRRSTAETYRVSHLVIDLGLVDLEIECSTILPTCQATSAKFPPAEAELDRQWNNQNLSQPNLVYDQMGHSVVWVKSRYFDLLQ